MAEIEERKEITNSNNTKTTDEVETTNNRRDKVMIDPLISDNTTTITNKIEEEDEDDSEHVILDVSDVRRSRSNTVISIQPHLKDSEENRIPIPITVSRIDSRLSQIIPLSGLQLLYDVTRLRIQQYYDLHHLTSELISENRYIIRNNTETGESLYGVTETSSSWQRILCGTRRSFNLTIVDQSQQEAMTFQRRQAISCPQLGLRLQRMDAYMPGGEYIGSVEQEWSPGYPNFTIRDANHVILYKVRANNCWTCSQTDFVFYIINAEDTEVLSHISHEWDRDLVDYNLSVVMPLTQSVKSKALIIAAAFLFEYAYFLPSKETGLVKSCCK